MSTNFKLGIAASVLSTLVVVLLAYAIIHSVNESGHIWTDAKERIGQGCGKGSEQYRAFTVLRKKGDDNLTEISQNIAVRCLGVNKEDYFGSDRGKEVNPGR